MITLIGTATPTPCSITASTTCSTAAPIHGFAVTHNLSYGRPQAGIGNGVPST